MRGPFNAAGLEDQVARAMCLLKIVEDVLDVDQADELDEYRRWGAATCVGHAIEILDRIRNSRSCIGIALDDGRAERRPEQQDRAGVEPSPTR